MSGKRFFAGVPALVAACAFLGGDLSGRELPPKGTDDARRPYEMVWAGRVADENAPALAPLTDPKLWRVDATNSIASFSRSTEHLLFGDGVSRLVYRATGGGRPYVRVRPPSPIKIDKAFDSFSCWIYGNNFYGNRPKGTPSTEVAAFFVDKDGKEFSLPLATVRHLEWCVFQKKLPEDVRRRLSDGAAFNGFSLAGGTNREDRFIEFCSFCVFKEVFRPLEFKPRAKRGVQVFKDQPQGVNTGGGRLPFPTAASTVVPVVTENPDIEFRFPEKGGWEELAFRFRKGGWIKLAKGGGVCPAEEMKNAKVTFRRIGDSAVADIVIKGGKVEELRFGGMVTDEDAELVPVPYYTYNRQGVAERPCVISTSCGGVPVFVSATADWTQSNASELFPARNGGDCISANGGVIYRPKTDGKRNDVYERFVWTVSTNFAATLPTVPNPVSPWKHITGTSAWQAYGAGNRAKDCEYWRKIRRMGMKRITVNDHESGWRDGDESFTFRSDPAPLKGGDKGQYDYARHMIDKLGFRYGPYNNFTDLAPVNAYWKADNVLRQSDGSYRESWARCYSPKPLFGLEMCEKLTPVIQDKFRFNTAYCDVHTAVTPWSRCDYDWRVPGAGTFAQTFYAYGEIMLVQKRCWGGPVYSEGGCHWMYCGLTDGNYAQDSNYDLPANPWLVDFDLLRMHPLCCNFGVGAPYMFYGMKNIYGPLWESYTDPFVACTIAFGHSPFLLHRNTVYSYFMIQALAARYTQADAEKIRYADDAGRLLDTSAAVHSGVYRRSQIATRYSDGTMTFVNGSRDGDWMDVRFGKRKVQLPPYGFIGMSERILTLYASKEGRHLSYSRSPEYVYVCARDGRWIDTIGGGTDGELIRLKEQGGTEEVIAVKSSEIVLPYAAVRIVGLTDVDMKETGAVPFTVDSQGRTRFKPSGECYSYRVTPPEDWVEPSPGKYLEAATVPLEIPSVRGKKERKRPMPHLWRSGMILRGSNEELPIDAKRGASFYWGRMNNEDVERRALIFHPPYKNGGTGCVFASYRIKIPKDGLTFSAKIAKHKWSDPGDGILFRIGVKPRSGKLDTVSELTVKDRKWHDISADLSRWAGQSVDLYLISDPGPADNTYGDGGGWADLQRH